MKTWLFSSGAGVVAIASALVSTVSSASDARTLGASDRVAVEAHRDGRAGVAIDRSEDSKIPIDVKFVNRRPWPVSIHWVDFGGVEKSYGIIPAGGELAMKTYVRHLWVFRRGDTHEEIWRWYAPSARGAGVVEIN
jgi:hypothetical protein